MAKHSWKAYFRRQEETAAPLQQPCTDDEQLPKYSESQNQEKSKVNQRTEAEKWEVDIIKKWNSETEAEKEKRRRLYSGLVNRLYLESNESLEKFIKSDLVELLDIAREQALTPPGPNLAEQLDKARGKSLTTPSIKAQNMPFENLSKLDLVGLLRVARVTPYYRLPKSEFMRVPNSDLVDLLREADDESLKRFMALNYREKVSRHAEREESHKVHEAKLHKDNQVCKHKDMPPMLPSKTELELRGSRRCLTRRNSSLVIGLTKLKGSSKQ